MDNVTSDAILVLGMHRSGTSAATRVLNLLGVDLGKDLLQPAEDNSNGFWEHRQIVAIHEHLLTELGYSWHDVRNLPEGWVESSAARDARDALLNTLTGDFSGSRVWAVKDPRLCRLLPLWMPLASELGVRFHALHVVRHPDEVAASLHARNGLALEHGRLLWLQHVVEAQAGASGLPRALLHFDQLLRDWGSQMVAVADQLKLPWPTSPDAVESVVDGFLNPKDRHHDSNLSKQSAASGLIARMHGACCFPVRDVPWRTLDLLVKECQETSASFLSVLDPFQRQLDEALAQVQSVSRLLLDLRHENDCLTDILGNLAARLPQSSPQGDYANDEAKVYYRRDGETYTESQAVSCSWPISEARARLTFDFDPGVSVHFLRFDPAERAGEFEIHGVWVDGKSLRIEHRVRDSHQYKLSTGEGRVRFGSWHKDPWIEVDLLGDSKNVSIHKVVIDCRRLTGVRLDWIETVERRLEGGLSRVAEDINNVKDLCLFSSNALQALEGSNRAQLRRLDALEEADQARCEGLHLLEKLNRGHLQKLEALSEVGSAHLQRLEVLEDVSRTHLQKFDSLEKLRQSQVEKFDALWGRLDEERQQMAAAFERIQSNNAILIERLDRMSQWCENLSEKLGRRWFDFLQRKR